MSSNFKITTEFATKAIHEGYLLDVCSDRPLVAPIYTSSTYDYDSIEKPAGDFFYSRHGNRSRDILEKAIAALENAEYGLCFSSGMSAIFSVFYLLNPGDHVICHRVLYGGTMNMLKKFTSTKGIEVTYTDLCNAEEIRKNVKDNTKMIYTELCCNPLVTVVDLNNLIKEAKKHDVLVVVDNTFITPYLQKPLECGVDIVIHSATKYISGHGDVLMGVLATRNHDLYERLHDIQTISGFVPSPFDCYLVSRSLKTLSLRMEQHMKSAFEVATYLEQEPMVLKVLYPGLKSHPQHEVAKRQFSGFGAVVGFFLKGSRKDVAHLLGQLKMIKIAGSLGQCFTVISYPATVSHAYLSESERLAIGITDNFVRLAIGLEDSKDIIRDLAQAIASFSGQQN